MPIALKIFRARSTSAFVVRVPQASAVAAQQTADGVLVIARMNRASATFSMLEIRTPAASEITSLLSSLVEISRIAGNKTPGFTPIRITSAFSATSAFSVVKATSTSFRKLARVCSLGSLAMISFDPQNFDRTRPRITEPANLPAPIKPSLYISMRGR